MRIGVFGATGGTGREVVRQALARGDEVTALARTPGALPPASRLRVVAGDATQDVQAVAQVVEGCEVVVSALGRRNSFRSGDLIVRSLRLIVAAMERAGVRRLILVSALGVGDTRRDAPLVPRLMYRALLGSIFADKEAAEAELRSSALDWTIVYPVLLTDGPRTGKYRVAERLELHGVPKISRSDVAHFVLEEAHRAEHARKGVAISY